MRPLPRKLALVCAFFALLSTPPVWCATITIVNADQPGEGFNDPTSVAPKGGNPGTTRGAQALNAFQYAADVLGALLHSDVEVIVTARFMPRDGIGAPLLDCGSTWAVLGAASPDWVCITDVINEHPNTDLWYPGALCNRLAGVRLEDGGGDPYTSDIGADFNGRLGSPGCLTDGGWYFGFDANGQNDEVDLVTVVLHELSHGLGFLTYANIDGSLLAGTPDVFMAYAYDNEQSRYWYQMSNSQRYASSENNPSVVWRGPRTVTAAQSYLVNGKDGSGRPRLYTPTSYEPGSSVSHFTNSADPNVLMEPAMSPSLDHTAHGIDITLPFLQDIGWRDPGCNNGILEEGEVCDNGELNSDETANACRTSCEPPSCGDGVTDSGEDCDDGLQNSSEPGHCRPGCVDFLCGDGVVDTGEECDDGGANANQPNSCRLNCRDPRCGDEVVDTGEECDDGADNGNDADACRASCEQARCGDGIRDSDEECDDGNQNANVPGACQLDCSTTCGDGVIDPSEECDDAAANADVADACRTNCLDPTCGDDIVDSGEACDDGNAVAGDGCDAACQTEAVEPTDAAVGGGAGGTAGSATAGAPDSGSMGGSAASDRDSGASGSSSGGQFSGVAPGEMDGGSRSPPATRTSEEAAASAARGACACRTTGAWGVPDASAWLYAALTLLLQRRRTRRWLTPEWLPAYRSPPRD
jgi:cysteine-rich repeat protein